MLAYEPDLQLIGSQYITDHHIIGPVISQGRSQFRQFAAVPDNDLVRVQQARQLYRNLFPSLGWPLDSGRLRHIVGHRDAEAAEQLNPFGNRVNKLRLLSEML